MSPACFCHPKQATKSSFIKKQTNKHNNHGLPDIDGLYLACWVPRCGSIFPNQLGFLECYDEVSKTAYILEKKHLNIRYFCISQLGSRMAHNKGPSGLVLIIHVWWTEGRWLYAHWTNVATMQLFSYIWLPNYKNVIKLSCKAVENIYKIGNL